MNSTEPQSWHLFCRVIDNYGDIGVSWRLATQLQAQFARRRAGAGAQITLIVDDLTAWRALVGETPSSDISTPDTSVTGIQVIPWQEPFPPPADCVIETFGCALPEAYRAQMPTRTRHWFILDYLSAEAWVPGCHGLASPQSNGLSARYIYPSILPETGGLLREDWLEPEHSAFQTQHAAWRARWHIPEPQGEAHFLFGYEQAALGAWIHDWATQPQPRTLYFAAGRLLADARRQLNLRLIEGVAESVGSLTLVALPFIPQREFDRLLWNNRFNIVRGEDSLTRALWAGNPLIWHIYPTEDGAHWGKLDALLNAVGHGLDAAPFRAWQQINHDWNAQTYHADHWRAFEQALPALRPHFAQLPEKLHALPELSNTIIKYSE